LKKCGVSLAIKQARRPEVQQTSGPDRVCVYGGDFESFDLLFDFFREAGSAGTVYDAMIESK